MGNNIYFEMISDFLNVRHQYEIILFQVYFSTWKRDWYHFKIIPVALLQLTNIFRHLQRRWNNLSDLFHV